MEGILPAKNTVIPSVSTVVHLHIVKLTHILGFQAEVTETQPNDMPIIHRYMPGAKLNTRNIFL